MYAHLIKFVSCGTQIFYVLIISLHDLLVSEQRKFKNTHYNYGFVNISYKFCFIPFKAMLVFSRFQIALFSWWIMLWSSNNNISLSPIM